MKNLTSNGGCVQVAFYVDPQTAIYLMPDLLA